MPSHSTLESSSEVKVLRAEKDLTSRFGLELDETQRARLQRGIRQTARLWQAEDGDEEVFQAFVEDNFVRDPSVLDTVFARFENLLEQLDGHMHEISREFRQQLDLDFGPLLPLDELFGGYDPSAHVIDDFFANKLAFIALLNFPLTTLEERLKDGATWSRSQWAEARLTERFSKRVPAEVKLSLSRVEAETGRYISEYNIWMHHLVDDQGQRLFPPQMRLLSHWGLRDEIKASYNDRKNGLAKQRLIQRVMERIILQTIPAAVINNPGVDWNPFSNDVSASAVKDGEALGSDVSDAREPDTRYQMWLKTFAASKQVDGYSPDALTLIRRRFDEDREIPEVRVKELLEEVLTSKLVPQVAKAIESRLGRKLEPFDIWYNGFRPDSTFSEIDLNEIVRSKYPTAEAFQKDIPNLLLKLGFSRESAGYLAANIVVDPGRGAGHAMGAAMRSAKAHLRTRVRQGGMDYKGFNVAAHELGHNVEQVLSLNDVDHVLLNGVPNTAFTEAFAFIFQGHDLDLLGLPAPDEKSEALKALNDFWATYEISGVALVDIAAWHWMYDHPEASPEQLRLATVQIAKDVWNRYYAPVFDRRDVALLGIYSHMIDSFLYLPDYPIGHIIAHQIEAQMKKAANIGSEFERMATLGRVTPDLWMTHATGNPVSTDALVNAASRALHTTTSS